MPVSPDHILSAKSVFKWYQVREKGEKGPEIRTILNGVDLNVRNGEFLTIVGPTGCGKSTFLKLILGSDRPSEGSVTVNSLEVKEPDRDRGVVFQRYSLFPNMSVEKNVMLGLELEEFSLPSLVFRPFHCRKRRSEFRERANEYLDRVGLLKHKDKYPHELSGGMRQRAAIAQAMVMKPEILLMDEPFGALDIGTREAMQVFVLEQWQQDHQTIIFVTHDLEEAIYLGTRIIVISPYYSEDDGSPGEGSKIVKDVKIPWNHPRPTGVKHTKEFNELMKAIRKEGLDPEYLQSIEEFDLSYEDGVTWDSHLPES